MKLIEVLCTPETDYERIHHEVLNKNIVLLKKVFSPQVTKAFRQELLNWRESTSEEVFADYFKEEKRNLQITLSNREKKSEIKSLDYNENSTLFDMYNYRIGNMHDTKIQKAVPKINEIGPKVLDIFYQVIRNPEITHAKTTGQNLFIEVAQFNTNSGHIEKHTHETVFNYGQKLNMVSLLSQKGESYDEGGLWFEDGDEKIDTTAHFEAGDSIFFRNDMIHWVDPIRSSQPQHLERMNGRWSMTLFYY
jgi:hypothetical protein